MLRNLMIIGWLKKDPKRPKRQQ